MTIRAEWTLIGLALGLAQGLALGCGDEAEDEAQQAQGTVLPAAGGTGGAPAAPAQPPATDTVAPEIAGVVTAGTVVKVLAEGFNGTEGPIGRPDGTVLFTETNASRVLQIAADDTVSTFLENTNGSNGLAFDANGRLISVQTTPGNTKIGVIYPSDAVATLSDNYQGSPYGRPNDLVVDSQGGVYFSEPGPNAAADGSQPATPPLPAAVYYVPPGGASVRVADTIRRPNGIVLSPDESVLYVNNTQGESLLAFDVQDDGTLQNQRNFSNYAGVTTNADGSVASGADGLAIDADGRVYAATTAGVQVFGPDGAALGIIPISRAPQNLAFAGPDKRTLYIVGRGAAYKVAMVAQGHLGRAK
jgi:gluconolactonase